MSLRQASRPLSLMWGIALLAAPALSAHPRERSWFERVEQDRDRGAGRIEDDQAWELRRLREDRYTQRRRRPGRDLERLDEERERRLRLDAAARGDAPVDARRTGGSV